MPDDYASDQPNVPGPPIVVKQQSMTQQQEAIQKGAKGIDNIASKTHTQSMNRSMAASSHNQPITDGTSTTI